MIEDTETGALRDGCYLKRLEEPVIYDAVKDEIYLVDEEAFARILAMSQQGVADGEAATLLRRSGLFQSGARRNAAVLAGRAPTPSLRYLEVQVTARCDKACRHCYQGSPSSRDMTAETLARILDQFEVMQGLKVMISGGEPLCHPRFTDLAGVLEGRVLRKVLITHGERIDGAAARSLKMFEQVQVSLDGWGGSHDSLRGPGSFRRAVAGIEALAAEGIPIGIATMVHRDNLGDFERMARFLDGLDVCEWGIDVPCPAGRWGREETGDRHLMRAMVGRMSYAFGGGFHGGSEGLACGAHLMTVFPDGSAAKCGFFADEAAGGADHDLVAAWKMVWQISLADLACDCDHVEECAGGCRFRARILTGDRLGPDPVQCMARGVEIKDRAGGGGKPG